ncbi:hypothetical protein SAMN04488021_1112 [Paracoccus aminovorans]|uniref:Uncharacterized protein n=1 Tax=Paracoccus aminovorans TaxID=34004 RepID=A0A1I2ZVY3_9RHOB|nr:hypothetical protein JCM7685_pAMV3p0428 [Paracoccus aminovorans]SFH41659.1 hypothetical protein SAMN04488021_1112 [Paracoccus aminovorans]
MLSGRFSGMGSRAFLTTGPRPLEHVIIDKAARGQSRSPERRGAGPLLQCQNDYGSILYWFLWRAALARGGEPAHSSSKGRLGFDGLIRSADWKAALQGPVRHASATTMQAVRTAEQRSELHNQADPSSIRSTGCPDSTARHRVLSWRAADCFKRAIGLFWLTDERMQPLPPFFPRNHGKLRMDSRRCEMRLTNFQRPTAKEHRRRGGASPGNRAASGRIGSTERRRRRSCNLVESGSGDRLVTARAILRAW